MMKYWWVFQYKIFRLKHLDFGFKFRVFCLECAQVRRFLLIRLNLFRHGYNVPPQFAWKFLFDNDGAHRRKVFGNTHTVIQSR